MLPRTMGVEEFLRAAVDLDRSACLLDEPTQCIPHGAVVIDDENGRRTRAAGLGCWQRRGRLRACRMLLVEASLARGASGPQP